MVGWLKVEMVGSPSQSCGRRGNAPSVVSASPFHPVCVVAPRTTTNVSVTALAGGARHAEELSAAAAAALLRKWGRQRNHFYSPAPL